MRKLLDRLFTREVVCRNCPHFRAVKKQLAISEAGNRSVTLGVCAVQSPVIAHYPEASEALQVRYERDWCPVHPLYDPLVATDDGAPVAYAPGDVNAKLAGFNVAPSLSDALKFAPGGTEFKRRFKASGAVSGNMENNSD